MPITSDRLAHVITAARQIELEYLTACEMVTDLIAKRETQLITEAEFLSSLWPIISNPTANISQACITLGIEEERYKLCAKHNRWSRDYMRRVRSGEIVQTPKPALAKPREASPATASPATSLTQDIITQIEREAELEAQRMAAASLPAASPTTHCQHDPLAEDPMDQLGDLL